MSEEKIAPGETQERPLVTFALLAYNQEKYIREAVEGAFAQTYEPLEIILSDDCSSDKTFQIIQEMAHKYNSAKRHVIVNKTPKNLGVWGHLSNVVQMSSGKYILLAAGDDISNAERTTIMTDLMVKKKCEVACSSANEIDAQGRYLKKHVNYTYKNNGLWKYIKKNDAGFIHGATSVYKKEFIQNAIKIIPYDENIPLNNEDLMLTAFAIAQEKEIIQYRKKALVNYRITDGTLSRARNGKGFLSIKKRLIESLRINKSRIFYLKGIMSLYEKHPNFKKIVCITRLKEDLRKSELELSASLTGFKDKLKAIRKIKKATDLKIVIPRIIGFNFMATCKIFLELIQCRFNK